MAVEIVSEEIVELITAANVGARVHHGTTSEILATVGILATIQFVHDHFPNGVGSGGTVLEITVALVRHAEVHGVRPQGNVLQWSSDGRIVEESLLFHHGELIVASHTEIRGTKTHDRVVGDIGVLVNDQSGSSHLLSPIINTGLGPEGLVVIVSDGMSSDLVTLVPHVLDGSVVGVLVGHEEGGLNVAIIGVLSLAVEDLLVKVDIVVIDGIVKSDHHHLRDILTIGTSGTDIAKLTRHLLTISRAEAIGELADGGIARRSSVRVRIHIWERNKTS